MSRSATAGQTCPRCDSSLARAASGPPWCPRCEWNLGAWDPEVLPARGWRWLERGGHHVAYRLDRGLFARLSTARPERPAVTKARVALLAVSLLIFLADLAAAGVGVWLIVVRPSFWTIFVGLLLILVALLVRPRFGRVPPRAQRLDRDRAPLLFDLVEQIAHAVGTTPPDHIVLTYGFNASVGRRGIRERTVLTLGGRLWLTLAPQLRVAVLAHELGHNVNGDPNRGLLVQPVMTSFGRLAEWTGAERTIGDIFGPDRQSSGMFSIFGETILWLISRVFLVIHLGLTALGMREHQRAEYLADAICADVAGTQAAVALMDQLLFGTDVQRLIYHNALHRPPGEWQASVTSWLSTRTDQLDLQRQHSARTTSLWDSHPPSGRRALLQLRWPYREPKVRLTDAQSDAIDAQLPNWIAAVHEDLLDTREFSPRRAPSS